MKAGEYTGREYWDQYWEKEKREGDLYYGV